MSRRGVRSPVGIRIGRFGRRRGLVWSAAVIVPVVGATLFLVASGVESAPTASRCGAIATGQAWLAGEAPAIIKPRPDDVTELKFGRSRSPRYLDFRPDVFGEAPPGGTPVATEVRPFVRDDGTTLALGQVVVIRSEVSDNAESLSMQVCVDPLYPESADAGSYKGSVIIDDPGFVTVELPMTVMLQQVPWFVPALFVSFALAIAVAFQRGMRWMEYGPATKSRKGTWTKKHPVSVEVIAGLSAALVAVIPVYLSQYEGNGAWAARPGEAWALGAGAFAAAAAAYATAAALVGRLLRNEPDGTRRQPPDASP